MAKPIPQTEKEWMDYIRQDMMDRASDFVCSWWIRLDLDNALTTPQINYRLDKLVKKGLLEKKVSKYATTFKPVKKEDCHLN